MSEFTIYDTWGTDGKPYFVREDEIVVFWQGGLQLRGSDDEFPLSEESYAELRARHEPASAWFERIGRAWEWRELSAGTRKLLADVFGALTADSQRPMARIGEKWAEWFVNGRLLSAQIAAARREKDALLTGSNPVVLSGPQIQRASDLDDKIADSEKRLDTLYSAANALWNGTLQHYVPWNRDFVVGEYTFRRNQAGYAVLVSTEPEAVDGHAEE